MILRLVTTFAVSYIGANYVKGRVNAWWNGPDDENRTPVPREEHLKQDPNSGAYIPMSMAIHRKIEGNDFYFESVKSYLEYRRQKTRDRLRDGDQTEH